MEVENSKLIEMKWIKQSINLSEKEEYRFEIGCNIQNISNKILCFNKNFDFEENYQNSGSIKNSYFRCDELLLQASSIKNLYSKQDGPRFRMTNVLY
jgi:hypothetical protein